MDVRLLTKQGIPVLSLIILGLSGVGINILIGRYYDIRVLGQFNSALAFYLVAAQLGGLGSYMAVLHFFTRPLEKIEPHLAWSALLTANGMAVVGSLGVILLSFILYWVFPGIFGSDVDTAQMILSASLGLPFFCINKNLLVFLNAQNHINTYFILQGLRYLLLFTILLVMSVAQFSSIWLGHVFWICEGILLLISVSFIIQLTGKFYIKVWKTGAITSFWVRDVSVVRHSLKAVFGGMVQELAVRVDIFMLTYLVEPFYVGIYSVAAMAAEGLNQVTSLVRDQLSPQIGNLHNSQKKDELRKLIKNIVVYSYVLLLIPGLCATLVFPNIVTWLFSNHELHYAGIPFNILMAGLYLTAPYHLLFYAPNQMGYPMVLTKVVIISTAVNLLLNMILISVYGVNGAAAATSLSWLIALILLGGWLKEKLS